MAGETLLALTRKTEYGLIAACHLAHTTGVVSARDIAEQHGIPLPLLMNVLKTLCHGGIVRSLRGARGGYALAQAAREITLADLIRVIEGPVRLVRCAGNASEEPACELAGTCVVRQPLHRVHEQLVTFLSGITIADLAGDERAAAVRVNPGWMKVLHESVPGQ